QSELTSGTIILSLDEGQFTHLFAYQPLSRPFTRLTNGPWRDIHPALKPDGRSVVFSSNRSGQWDIYSLDLQTGDTQRLTNTPQYDGSPSWSPDGQWLVYETYLSETVAIQPTPTEATSSPAVSTPPAPQRVESLELMILPVSQDGTAQDPIRLTNDLAADYAPSWSPSGRKIIFVSNRSGDDEIWLADL
ncbi:MAG: TolB family protein, partial [Anaerolineales bacterium]